jgi:hypothetical protein
MPAGEQSKLHQNHLAQQREAHDLAEMDHHGADKLALSALFAYNITPLCFGKRYK